MATTAVILAGGLGTRMRSDLPKVLHVLAGQPLIETVLRTILEGDPSQVLVVGSQTLFAHPAWKEVRARTAEFPEIQKIVQECPLGTGHAVQTALPFITGDRVLIVHADVPLIQPETLRALEKDPADVVLGMMKDPGASYGRVLLNEGRPVAVVEAAECKGMLSDYANAGVYGVSKKALERCLPTLKKHGAELYFTDLVAEAVRQTLSTSAQEISADEAYGINTPEDLLQAPVQPLLRRRQKDVIFQDPEHVVLSMDTRIGACTTVGAFNVFGPGVTIGRGATILPFCVLEDCTIEDGATVGPFAHLKMGTHLGAYSVVGNFVEVKKTTIGPGTKAKHLSYLGDATIGANVNIGAGTIVCNYDGFRKHPTVLEDGAQIGANASLVAPLTIGRDAFIGAGSVITKDVPPETLAVARSPQVHNETWVAKRKRATAASKEE